MRVTEQLYSKEQHTERTDSLSQAPQKIPLTRVQDHTDGLFEADFLMALTGVACEKIGEESSKANAEHKKSHMGLLFSSLSAGELLEFIYSWRGGPANGTRFAWRIRGSCFSSDRVQAERRALDLFRNLDVSLRALSGEYRITPVAMHSSEADTHPWRYELRSLGLVIPASELRIPGFSTSLPISQSINLPILANDTRPRFDAAVIDAACHGMMTIRITIESARLTDNAVAMISAARMNFREGKAGLLKYQSSPDSCVLDDEILYNTLVQLEKWLRDPRGYRIRCFVTSDEQLPHSYLEVIGHEIFGGLPVLVNVAEEGLSRRRNNMDGNAEQGILDLGDCFHRSSDPSSLFPESARLVALGICRSYGHAPPDLPAKGLLLGRVGYGQQSRDVRILHTDRSRHIYAAGATGTGKSTLLQNMLLQDIENGEGVCLIDPHGDLFHQVLNSIPEKRANDVVLVDLCDFDYAVGLNFLECEGPYKFLQPNFIVNEMLSIFDRLYDMKVAGGPVFETYIRNAMLLVMENNSRQATLLDVVRVFEDEDFRRVAKSQCSNPLVVSFWSNLAEKAGGEVALKNVAGYITSKLNQFTHNALLRPIIGQATSSINFRDLMDSGKIVLVNLARGLLSEIDVKLIGMLLMGKIFNAAMSRINQPPGKRRPFHLFLDEFQVFLTPTIASLLSEARKFGLYLTLANQNLAQLYSSEKNRSIMETVLGNVATTLFFRLGPKDADELLSYSAPYLDSYGMQYLPDYHAVCRMLNRNTPSAPFVFTTFPPQSNGVSLEIQERIVEGIRRNSRDRYARPREGVECDIMKSWVMADKNHDTAKVH